MPGPTFNLNLLSPAAATAMNYLGWYMENTNNRNATTYYWAQVSNWYLKGIGLTGVPSRRPTAAELRGLGKIKALRQTARQYLVGRLRAGAAVDQALQNDVASFMDSRIRQDADMVASARFIQNEFAVAGQKVSIQMPSLTDMVAQIRGQDPRSDLERAATLEGARDIAEGMRENARRAQGETGDIAAQATPHNIYDRVRAEDLINYMRNEYESPFDPLGTSNEAFGPAPDLGAPGGI
jgi:hypothetical protein